MLDRLMRGAVLAEADGIVREHVDALHAHQRRETDCVARVVGEHQEGADIGHEATMQAQAVGYGAHAELAHAVKDVLAAQIARH